MKVKEGESPETRQVVKNLIENKLFLAEQKREKELQKRLEHLRKHVGGSDCASECGFNSFCLVLS